MPKRKGEVTLSALMHVGSDGETRNSDQDMTDTPESRTENVEPAKKAKGRSKVAANKVTGPKKTSRQNDQDSSVVEKKPVGRKNTTSKRQALKEKRNDQFPSDTEEMEDLQGRVSDDTGRKSAVSGDELDASVVAVKQPAKGRRPPKRKIDTILLEEVKTTATNEPSESVPAAPKNSKGRGKASSAVTKPKARGHHPPTEEEGDEAVIPETQQVPMDADQSSLPDEEEDEVKRTAQLTTKRTSHKRAEATHKQPQVGAKRGGGVSDNEGAGGDPATRRRLGELTKKLENLDFKYNNLREVGIKEAEANFEKLKNKSEERSKSANELIASLKKELTTQTALAKESRSLQKQLSSRDSELLEARAKVVQLSTSLFEAQNENKAVQAKLAASRTAAASVESVHAKVPGSAIKPNGQARTLMVGSAEAAQAAQVAQLKEDLYSDLTGLILRGVKRGEDSDVYDCIQTGRNGTLHFKLAVAADGTGKSSSYEDTEFQYTPHLDAGRDSQLMELLPEYLTEEITFSRQNAAKFYARVVEALTKRKLED